MVGEVGVPRSVAVDGPDLPRFTAPTDLALLHEHELGAVRRPIRRPVVSFEAVAGQDELVLTVGVHRYDLETAVLTPRTRSSGSISLASVSGHSSRRRYPSRRPSRRCLSRWPRRR